MPLWFLASPGSAAGRASPGRAASEQAGFDEPFGEGGVMSAPVVAGGQSPDVAGVLAERVSHQAAPFECVEAVLIACQGAGPGSALWPVEWLAACLDP